MITKFNHGPAVTIVLTLEMLALLQRAARGDYHATEEECQALISFQQCSEKTLAYCVDHPHDRHVVHGFCV